MTVDRDGIKKRKYWEPNGETYSLPRNPRDIPEALRELLFQAVENRLHPSKPVSALLSGGLDSSAVVSIAARCLEKQNRQLTAISAVLPEAHRSLFADEREFIEEFRSWPNVRIHYVTADGRGPFDSLYEPQPFAVFPIRPSTFYLIEECEKLAISNGSQSLLWGIGGEMGPTAWGERYYLELALKLQLPALIREMKAVRAVRGVSPLRVLRTQVLDALFPDRHQAAVTVLARDFQRECEAKSPPAGRFFSVRPQQLSNLRAFLRKHAAGHGQRVSLILPSAPLLDKRVLEFCLALPAEFRLRDGYSRYPVRCALDGILPRRIQWRTTKTPFSPDYFVRYNAQLGMARDFVEAISQTDPVRSIVDVEQLKRLMIPVDPVKGSIEARFHVPTGCYLINFLRQFAEFRL